MNEIDLKEKPLVYATFMQRFHAFIVDNLIFIPISIWSHYNLLHTKSFPLLIFITLIWWCYKPLMEWKLGATIGKRAAKIKVINKRGSNPTFNQAMLRFTPYFAVSFGQLLFYYKLFQLEAFKTATDTETLQELGNSLSSSSHLIGVFFFAFSISFILSDKQKQAFHDRYSETFCVQE